VDRLNIIVHDKFQEIVDEANRSDSPIHLKAIYLDRDKDFQKTKTVVASSNFFMRIQPAVSALAAGAGKAANKPLFEKPAEQKFAQAVATAIHNHEDIASSRYLLNDDLINMLAAEAKAIYAPVQDDLPGIKEEIDYRKITKETARTLIEETIDIPRILIVPKGSANIVYTDFILQCDSIQYQPFIRDLLIRHLRTSVQETLSSTTGNVAEERLEDYLVRSLIDFEDISYDDESDLLYDLSSRMIAHLKTYLKTDEDVSNIVLHHQKQLADFIHAQMLEHQSESCSDFEVKISKGFTALRESAFSAEEGVEPVNFRQSDFDKSKIGKLLFSGFSKCLYPFTKFDSDTERRFSIILEQDSLKWFKPARGQFQIFYQTGNETSEYVPDFVAETQDTIYMVETKAENQINSPEVQSKRKAAESWCTCASEHNARNKGKPWKYLLISHESVKENMTIDHYAHH
jgi:type III restriction enzyme